MKTKIKEEEDVCSEESSTTDDEEEGEEELALFKDMRARERQDFLHRLSDDSDESISIKLGSFSSFKFHMSGKHDEIPNGDIGRTDYNWLLTPPGTPLFPTLDKETPHVEISERSKLQSKARKIPRILRTGSNPGGMHSSSSPQRSSPISSSCSINSYSRGRASSSTPSSRGNLNSHCSTSTVRSSTATANSSSASAKLSTPSSMFSSLTFQRSSAGSTCSSCSSLVGKAAPSLQQRNCRGGSSPYQQAQQMTIPGFPSQPPPNLSTRISDHDPLPKRCSSPFSRYRGETKKKSRHQSASPNFSKTGSSTENHDCDPHISQNKGCTMSSSADVMMDIRLKIKQGSHASHRGRSLLKDPGRSESASKVSGVLMSKRVPNSRTQQRNLRQNSQSMFRPLLSNVPVTSFYAKKETPLPYQGNTNNSSVSTNGTGCIAPITEVPDHGNKGPGSESSKCFFSHDQEKIKDIEKMGVSRGANVFREESTNQDYHSCSVQMHRCLRDRRSVQSVLGDGQHDIIGTSQVDLRSEFQRKESCTLLQDRDDGQNCIARENASVQNVLGKVLLEGKAELSSRCIDSFKLSTRKNTDNLGDQEAASLDFFDLPGNVFYFKGSFNVLNNDESGSRSKPNDTESHILDVSRLDLEDLASKAHFKVASGEHSGTHEAEVLSEGAPIEGSIDLFADVGDRCILKYTAAEKAIAETQGRKNDFKPKDLEIYSVKNVPLLLQESLLASQKDEKPIEGIPQDNDRDANCLSRVILSLETQEQKYCHSKSHELSENCGCFLYEKYRVDSVTQASLGLYKQEKECTNSEGSSVTVEIGGSLQAAGNFLFTNEYTCRQESNLCNCKYASLITLKSDIVSVTVSPSNLETEMEHPASATLEGNTSTDGNAIFQVLEGDKAQQGHISQGDSTFHGNATRRCVSRSMTLEEATDTVLFCSSIVHDLVYKSTMISIQKEIVGVTPIPTMTGNVGLPQVKRRNFCRGAAAQRMLTYKSINSRKTVAHLYTPSSRIETTIEDQQPVMHVNIGERNELPMPGKVNSKCHCTIL